MGVTIDDVRHIAALARLGLDVERARGLVAELNTILDHMEVLSKVDTAGVEAAVGVGAAGTPLRADVGGPPKLVRTPDAFAPAMREGFFVVPRLATHETTDADG
ncbi:MAG: Asp-tRNA(Asn)/Glu-tRNA(Gln) amidotransferase subunit GatC [Gemmatimonadaceae bacterium]